MKWIVRIGALLLGLVVLVVVGALFLLGSLDTIARTGVEKGSTYALAVPTTLDSADVDVFGGSFAMSGLTVSNPEGFTAPHFLALNDGGVQVDLGTLRADTIELPSLRLTGLDVHLQKADGKANYEVILENLKRFESGDKADTDPGDRGGKNFIIREVRVENVTAHVALLPIGGDATKVDVEVPEIVLTNVGSGDDSVDMAELVGILTKAILTSIVSVGGDVIPADMLGGLQSGLDGLSGLGDVGVQVIGDAGQVLGDLGGDAAEALGGAADEAAEAAGQALEGAGEGLKNILGGGGGDDDKN